MDADVASRLKRRGFGKRGEGSLVGRRERELQLFAALRRTEPFDQAEVDADFVLAFRVRREQLRVRREATPRDITGGAPGAEQRHERVEDAAAAVQLQRKLEPL